MIPAENVRDWRGRPVVDPDGARIGDLDAVYVDTLDDEPAFATVRITAVFGRARLAFVPLAGATVAPAHLKVAYPRARVREAPSIATDGELPAAEEHGVFAHYGLEHRPGAHGERRLARR